MRKYISTTITTNKQANDMLALVDNLLPQIGAFDSETNGLHIIQATPFLFQFGFLHPTEHIGYTFAVDIERQPQLATQVITQWHIRAACLEKYLAHNVKFDLHMLTNLGLPYLSENVSDTMFYIRYGHDAIAEKNGGPSLKLKKYCAKFIDRSARYHDKLIQAERSSIAKALNFKLKQRMSRCAPPTHFKAMSWTIGAIDAFFKDPIADATTLPKDAAEAYDDWLQLDVPIEIRHAVTSLVETDMIPYNWCNRETLIEYAHLDIVWVLEIYESLAPIVTTRDNTRGIEIEDSLIFPLYEMERVGFVVDKPYIVESKQRVREYIIKCRATLESLIGVDLRVSQHVKILLRLNELGAGLESTNDDIMELRKSELLREDADNPVVKAISALQELRTLEKWYSTYICKYLVALEKDPKLYTTINQVGTVTGRVSSDFQQFPKSGILTADGELLYHPRHMVIVSGGHHKAVMYADYSQIELRFQAMYTILVGHPDLNLCRAYMPYKCIRKNGTLFDYTNQEHITQAYDGSWYYEEDPNSEWTPTDVHGATTKAAFNIDETHPDFHALRYKGKRVNFAKNYGAKFAKIWSMFPEYDEFTARDIDNAYYTAFPGVKEYHEYCYRRANEFSNTINLFGIRYYGTNGHILSNQLVQGSAAFFLKLKTREIYDYCKANNIKSKWQMQVHDELFWQYDERDNPNVLLEFKRIMEYWPDGLVPIISDLEITTTAWDEKKEVKTIEEIIVCLSS